MTTPNDDEVREYLETFCTHPEMIETGSPAFELARDTLQLCWFMGWVSPAKQTPKLNLKADEPKVRKDYDAAWNKKMAQVGEGR